MEETDNLHSNDGEPLLVLREVMKAFGGLTAVDGCSFDVAPGTITGLIGPNGAGKSTALNLIAGAMRPDAGEIVFQGRSVNGLGPHERTRRGIVRTFQIPRPIPTMTVLENLMLAGGHQPGERLANVWFRPERVGWREGELVEEALSALTAIDLIHRKDAPATDLSGGQKKLLEFARTLMMRPKLVLLDEPAAGVNRVLMAALERLVVESRDRYGITFLVVEHDMELVARLCDPVVVMHQGRTLCQGTFRDVSRNRLVLEAYLGGRAA